MNVAIEMTGWRELQEAFERSPQILREELGRAMQEADQILEREVKDLTPSASGVSRNSIFSHEQRLDAGALGVVGTAQPHVAYVELGTRPHFPPLAPLQDWVRVKLGLPEKEARGVAWLIARKIAARGTLGVGMFHRAFARNRDQVAGIFERARDRIRDRLAGG